MTMTLTVLSTYFSTDGTRTAEIRHRPIMGYEVAMYEHGQLKETRGLSGYNQQYAEDCAENWVERIIK